MLQSRLRTMFLIAAIVATSSCGPDEEEKPPAPKSSSIELAFTNASSKHKIWQKLLFTIAYLSSKIEHYPQSEAGEDNLPITETIFGLKAETLGIPTDSSIPDQIEAYSSWLEQDKKIIELETNPEDSNQRVDWIWKLAGRHFPNSRELQVVLTLELIDLMNEGFTWYDPELDQHHKVNPEPTIQIEDLSPEYRSVLSRRLGLSEAAPAASFLPIVRNSPGQATPNSVLISHCPFTLSLCLKLQTMSIHPAHYIIPPSPDHARESFQIRYHQEPITTDQTDNAVVVMLTGYSGRIVDGVREAVNPLWLTKWQLEQMGQLTYLVCRELSRNPNVHLDSCLTVTGTGSGVHFLKHPQDEPYRFNQLADFSELIFSAYINGKGNAAGDAALQLPTSPVQPNQAVNISASVLKEARLLQLERLVRCGKNDLRWIRQNSELTTNGSVQITKAYDDPGPNFDGHQFLRITAFDATGTRLLGWDHGSVKIEPVPSSEEMLYPGECSL